MNVLNLLDITMIKIKGSKRGKERERKRHKKIDLHYELYY